MANFRNSIYANRIDVENIISTVLFLGSWAMWGVYEGYHKKRTFQLFLFFYGLGTLISVSTGQYYTSILMGFFSLFSFIPMYGFAYYIQQSAIEYRYLLLVLPLVISWFGYLTGQNRFIGKQILRGSGKEEKFD